MLPNKKKTITRIFIIIIITILFIFLMFQVTKYAKNDNQIDNYPKNVKYIGIVNDLKNSYEKLVILDDNFNKIGTEINCFYKIKDYKIINNRFIFFSDALNEIAYNKKKKVFYIKELNSYLSNLNDIKISDNYIVELDDKKINAFNLQTNKKIQLIDNVFKLYDIIKNNIFYADQEGLKQYNLETNDIKIIATTNNLWELIDYNETYLLFKDLNNYKIYDIQNNKINDIDKYIDLTKSAVLGIYKDNILFLNQGNIQYYSFSKKDSFTLNYQVENKIANNYQVGNYYYLNDNNKSIILDIKNDVVKKKLTSLYQKIIKVN